MNYYPLKTDYSIEAEYAIQDSDDGEDLAFTVPMKPFVALFENIEKGSLDRTHKEYEEGSWSARISLGVEWDRKDVIHLPFSRYKRVKGSRRTIKDREYILYLPPPALNPTSKFFRNNIVHSCVLYMHVLLIYITRRWIQYGGEIVEDLDTKLLTFTEGSTGDQQNRK